MPDASSAERIHEWLVDEANKLDTAALVDALAWRLRAAGVPLDRFSFNFRLLSAKHIAASIIWRPNEPMHFTTYDWAQRDLDLYKRSPFKVAHETGSWLALDLAETPDDRFGIVPDLKEMGFRHYLVIPVILPGGDRNTVTLATRESAGFGEQALALIRRIMPPIALLMEIKMLHRSFRDVLATYVGRGPAREIVSGLVHRGDVTRISAAILMADLRGFTAISTQMPPEATAEVLNRYYDAVVPSIEAHGGEILKFIGDAVLAIFPEPAFTLEEACHHALDTAQEALAEKIAPLKVNGSEQTLRFGIAVHVGEVVYGNVGSGTRLDYTVVGRDVNVAARIAALCSTLDRPFLVSAEVKEIAARSGRSFRLLGAHMVRGLSDPLAVYEPVAGRRDVAALHQEDEVPVRPTLL